MRLKTTRVGIKALVHSAFIWTILLALHTRADTSFIGGVIFSGSQTYTNPVVLTNDTTILANPGNITFLSTVDGPYNLIINTAGTTTFEAAVGGNIKLASLLVGTNTGGPTTLDHASIITTGKQNYSWLHASGSVSLISTEGGSITFSGIDNIFAGPDPLDLVVSSAGTTTLNGNMTSVSSLTVGGGGTFVFNGSILDTAPAGSETFNESVILLHNTSVSCSNITFASTVDGTVGLQIYQARNVTFCGPCGNVAPLTNLQIYPGSGGTAFLNTSIITSGPQSYGIPVVLGAPTTLTSLTDAIIFSSSIDGTQPLTLMAPGTSSFGGSVGGTTVLTSLTVGGGGTINIKGNSITTAGPQNYNENVYLTELGPPTPSIIALTSLGGSNIIFGGTINGYPYDALSVNTSGTTTLNGIVGGNGVPYSLTTSASGSVTINTTAITTFADQSYGNVTLKKPVSIQTTSVNRNISFGTIDGAYNLSIIHSARADSGTNIFNGIVGGVTPLAVLNVVGGATELNAVSVTTAVAQFYDYNVFLRTNVCLTNTGGLIAFQSTVDGAQNLTVISHGGTGFVGPVGSLTPLSTLTVGGGGTAYLDASITTTGLQSYNQYVKIAASITCMSLGGGDITFAGALDGPSALTLSTSGAAALNGPVGGNPSLAAFTATGGGTIVINGGLLKTTGPQTFNEVTALGGDTTLSGSPLSLPTLTGNNHVLTLSNSLVSALGGLNNGLAQLVIAGGGAVALDATFSVPSVNVSAPATLTGSGLIIAPVTVQPGATLAPDLSSGPFTLVDSLNLSGTTVMELNSAIPTNDLARTFGNIAYGGTLTVANLAGTLAAGDSFRLFQGGTYTGTFSNLNLPALSAGLIWDTHGLTNNGSLLVAALPALTSIAMTGPNDFQLTATGTPGRLYNVLASTNAALPVAQWWVIGSVAANNSGTITFTDSTATNGCRFYRLGQ